MKPGHVTLATKAVIYTVTGPSGGTLEMRQEGDEWNEMVCMRGTWSVPGSARINHGELILTRTETRGLSSLLSESMAGLWGDKSTEWTVVKASPMLIDLLGLLPTKPTPEDTAGEA